MTPRLQMLMLCAAVALGGCADDAADVPPAGTPAPARDGAPPGALDRAETLGAFLDGHWQLPVPLQGPPPAGASEAEASLSPATCGACHPRQYAEWQETLHAAAYSPGFAGQLIEGGLAAPAALRQCQTCHTPLEEQQPVTREGAPSAAYDPALRAGGIVCAACHVRAHRRLGPPRRAGLPPPPDPLPHGGFEARAEFQDARFCAPCHQFFGDAGVNGKPLENTYAEWAVSPQAKAGRTCQSCHMPDRGHHWRGIHDPETVRSGVGVTLELADRGAELRAQLGVHNRDVGHAFPTYVTPRVFLAVWQVDAAGAELPETRRTAVIGREIDFSTSPWSERFDTRVLPGESVELPYAVSRHADAVSLVGRVTVDPDFHYRGVFASLLESYTDPHAVRLMREALAGARGSQFVLDEVVLALDAPSR